MRITLFLLLTCCVLPLKAQENTFYLKAYLQNDSSSTLIVGHRGGFYEEMPENSFATYDYTLRQSCQLPIMLEIDIKASKEGDLFVFHDDELSRMTNGQGIITESTTDYLKSLCLKNQKGEITKEKIPLFDSVLNFVKHKNAFLMIDVKAKIWGQVLAMIQKFQMTEKCIILTFKDEDAKLVYQLDTKSQISVLVKDENTWKSIQNLGIPFQNLIAYINQNTSKQVIEKLLKNKIPVMTDVSEHKNHKGLALSADFYLNLIKEKILSILITDFPVILADICCEK